MSCWSHRPDQGITAFLLGVRPFRKRLMTLSISGSLDLRFVGVLSYNAPIYFFRENAAIYIILTASRKNCSGSAAQNPELPVTQC